MITFALNLNWKIISIDFQILESSVTFQLFLFQQLENVKIVFIENNILTLILNQYVNKIIISSLMYELSVMTIDQWILNWQEQMII